MRGKIRWVRDFAVDILDISDGNRTEIRGVDGRSGRGTGICCTRAARLCKRCADWVREDSALLCGSRHRRGDGLVVDDAPQFLRVEEESLGILTLCHTRQVHRTADGAAEVVV